MNKQLAALLGAVVVMTWIAGPGRSAVAWAIKPEQFVLATGTEKGVYAPLGKRLAMLASKSLLPVVDQLSSGSAENIDLLTLRKVHFAFVQSSDALDAYRGRLAYASNPHPGLRGIIALYPDFVQCLARKGTGVHSWADLSSKRLATGPKGSGTERRTLDILKLYGHGLGNKKDDVRLLRLPFVSALKALQQGKADAAVLVLGAPSDLVQAALDAGDLAFVSIEPNMAATLERIDPAYLPGVLEAGTYGPKQPEAVQTLSTKALLACNKEVDGNDVYRLLTVLFEHKAVLEKEFPALKGLTPTTGLKGMTVPLHPGARKFYADRGLAVPMDLW